MATKASHLLRPLVALVALVAAMAALLIAYNASPAHAAGSCSTASGTTTCTYASTGAEDTFKVPDGVSTIHVVAQGAPGSVGDQGGSAGRGARVSGDLTVAPGQTLYVEVGGVPTGSGTSNCYRSVACIGGFNGGGTSRYGGGGGGASDVRTVSRDQSVSLSYRLIVAGGGGGSGEGTFCGSSDTGVLLGGAGGDAGSDGGYGPLCDILHGGGGGKSGGQLAGGTGGAAGAGCCDQAPSGVLGRGGDGGSESGGGGGGGLFGGGGGGSSTFASVGSNDLEAPAGGGGGGSNLVPPGGSAEQAVSGDPSIAISFPAGVGEPPPTEEPENRQACKKGGYEKFGFKNQGQCIKAVNHAS